MKKRIKIAGALACVAFLGGVIVAAAADRTTDYNTGPIWIGDAASPASDTANAARAANPAIGATGTDQPKTELASTDAGLAPVTDTTPFKQLADASSAMPQVIAPLSTLAAEIPRVVVPAAAPAPTAVAAPAAAPTPGPAPSQAPAAVLAAASVPAPAAAPAADTANDNQTAPVQQAQNVPIVPTVKPIVPNRLIPTLPSIAGAPASSGGPSVVTPSGGTPSGVAPPTAPVTQASVTFTGTSGKDLDIEINRGALVRLQVPADTVFVANPDVADIQVKSPRLIYVFGKRAGETVLYAVDANDNLLLNTRVVVSHNIQALRTALRGMVPSGGVAISTAGDALVLEGSVTSASQAEDIRRLAARFAPGEGAVVNNLHVVAPNQVNLRVRIAEVSRDTLKQFGINWDNAIKLGGFVFGLAQGSPVINTTAGADFGKTIVRNNGTNSIAGSFRNSHVDLNAVIDALANENLITVLAEPNLTAMSGETANFLAGGEFPIPVPQSGTGNAITVEFKKFGVSLAFTPTVVDGSRINLKVRPEVSQLSTVGSIVVNSISIPALTTRNAETTVELASGQSFAIAGLLQHNSQQDASKTPFLGDLPVLGALFKSDRYQRNETELVIVVTPYLVKPVSANSVATPVDGLTPPTDVQRIFYGTKNQQKLPEAGNAPRNRDGNTVVGPAGFQLD